jgi:hypothetical protein
MKKALVLSLAVVLGLGVASFAQTLSGSWDTVITIDPVTPVAIGISSELTVTYEVSGWSFSSYSKLTELGWTKQHFDVIGTLGVFTLGSVLTFTPAPVPAFTKWVVTGGLTLVGVSFDGTFTLTPGNTTFEIVGAGTAGLVGVEVDVTFGNPLQGTGCDFDWQGVDITVGFPFCCAEITSTISFGCAGFEEVTFEVVGIAIPALPWVTLDALLTFQTGSKTLVLTPNFDFGAFVCFDLYITQASTGAIGPHTVLTLSDITIEGIGIVCEIGGVQFTGISWWGVDHTSGLPGTDPYDLKPGLLNGTPYWEAYQIATTDDGCCGPFNFDVTVYFLDAGMLFDVAEFDANMSIQIATQFTFSMGINIGVAAPAFTSWELGFLVEW